MRQVVGGRAKDQQAASTSQMGRFETEMLTQPKNLQALMDLPGKWIDRVRQRQPSDKIILDLDSSVSETYGRAGRLGLQRALRMHLLPPAVLLQPVRRPGAGLAAQRQRRQCR